jgi:hypothetical protein
MVPLSGAKAGVVGMHSRSFGPRNALSLRKYSSRRGWPHPTAVQALGEIEVLRGFWAECRFGRRYPGTEAALDLRPLQHAVGVVPYLEARPFRCEDERLLKNSFMALSGSL